MRDLFLLVDYKGQLWCPHRPGYSFPDPDRLGAVFADRGWRLRIRRFSEVDLRTQDYRGQVVLYQSSQAFRSPFASIDMMHDGQRYYLGEIQFVRFGTTTLLGSPHHFRRGGDGAWTRVEGRDQWDEVFATCVADYLEEPA